MGGAQAVQRHPIFMWTKLEEKRFLSTLKYSERTCVKRSEGWCPCISPHKDKRAVLHFCRHVGRRNCVVLSRKGKHLSSQMKSAEEQIWRNFRSQNKFSRNGERYPQERF